VVVPPTIAAIPKGTPRSSAAKVYPPPTTKPKTTVPNFKTADGATGVTVVVAPSLLQVTPPPPPPPPPVPMQLQDSTSVSWDKESRPPTDGL